MKTLQVLSLLVAFVAAVLLPGDDVGTHDKPATGGKTRVVKCHPVKPNKAGPALSLVSTQLVGLERFSDSKSSVCRSPRTAAIEQLNPLLLI